MNSQALGFIASKPSFNPRVNHVQTLAQVASIEPPITQQRKALNQATPIHALINQQATLN
jgi:hypothetical protein